MPPKLGSGAGYNRIGDRIDENRGIPAVFAFLTLYFQELAKGKPRTSAVFVFMEANKTLELGAWIGRSQALRLVATHCGAAEAQCLKTIKDCESYKQVDMNWEEFCQNYLGIHRSTAEDIIRRFEEFGPAYFKLAELMRISPAAYRQIESAVSSADDCLVLSGESIPINRENSQRLIEAVGALVKRKAVEDASNVELAARRLEKAVADLRRFIHKNLDPADRFLLAGYTSDAGETLRQLAEELRA